MVNYKQQSLTLKALEVLIKARERLLFTAWQTSVWGEPTLWDTEPCLKRSMTRKPFWVTRARFVSPEKALSVTVHLHSLNSLLFYLSLPGAFLTDVVSKVHWSREPMLEHRVSAVRQRELCVSKRRQDPRGIPRRLKGEILPQHMGFIWAIQEFGSVITSRNSSTIGIGVSVSQLLYWDLYLSAFFQREEIFTLCNTEPLTVV